MEINDLIIFKTVASEGSISKAAKSCLCSTERNWANAIKLENKN